MASRRSVLKEMEDEIILEMDNFDTRDQTWLLVMEKIRAEGLGDVDDFTKWELKQLTALVINKELEDALGESRAIVDDMAVGDPLHPADMAAAMVTRMSSGIDTIKVAHEVARAYVNHWRR